MSLLFCMRYAFVLADDLMEGGKPPRDCRQSLRPYNGFYYIPYGGFTNRLFLLFLFITANSQSYPL